MSEFAKNTIGYHWQMSKAVFGEESSPTRWLEKKAAEAPDGMNETVVMAESQVVYLLGQMYLQDQKDRAP